MEWQDGDRKGWLPCLPCEECSYGALAVSAALRSCSKLQLMPCREFPGPVDSFYLSQVQGAAGRIR